MRLIKKCIAFFVVALTVIIPSCDRIETPVRGMVRLNLDDYGRWATYGVSGVGNYRCFNKMRGIPKNYPFAALEYTGIGGVLLICDVENIPRAFDLCCPVESKNSVCVEIDANNYDAVCPKCGSRYNVIVLNGAPISGQALTKKVGLGRYNVMSSGAGGYIIVN